MCDELCTFKRDYAAWNNFLLLEQFFLAFAKKVACWSPPPPSQLKGGRVPRCLSITNYTFERTERRTGSRCLLPHARARTALLRLSLASLNTTLPPRRHERRNKEHTTAGINGLSYPRLAGVTVCAPRPSVRSAEGRRSPSQTDPCCSHRKPALALLLLP